MKEENKKTVGGTIENILEFLKTYASKGLVESIISGIVILVIIMTATGTPVSSITDRWFGLQEQQVSNTYDLQLKTFEFLQTDVMSKLDEIYERLNNAEDDVDDLQYRMRSVEVRIDTHK